MNMYINEEIFTVTYVYELLIAYRKTLFNLAEQHDLPIYYANGNLNLNSLMISSLYDDTLMEWAEELIIQSAKENINLVLDKRLLSPSIAYKYLAAMNKTEKMDEKIDYLYEQISAIKHNLKSYESTIISLKEDLKAKEEAIELILEAKANEECFMEQLLQRS